MLFKNQRKNTPAALLMFPLVLFMLFFNQVLASVNDTVPTPDTLSAPVRVKKEFTINLQPDLVSETSAAELRAGLIYDVTSNTIVWEKDMRYAYPIASLTKMMVALIAMEEIKEARFDWQDEIKEMRTYRLSKRSRKTYSVNERFTLEGLLKLAMIPSNNEACGMIARHIGGSVEAFVKMMNDKAAELGMSQTFYSNPSGLPAGVGSLDNSSSPNDLLRLATELIKFPEILAITNIAFAEVENGHGSNVYRNHNHLVMEFPNEVDGLKTGYTKNAKFCLVATARKNDHRLIAIALGARGPAIRNQIVSEMLSNYYIALGIGPLGNQNVDPLYAKSDSKTTNAIAESNVKSFPQQIVYKTVTSIVKKPHTVKAGQTLSEIAEKYSVSIDELKKWNKLKGSKILKGQKLYVQTHVKRQVPVKVDMIENYDACEDDAEDCGNENSLAAQKIIPSEKAKTKIQTENLSAKNEGKMNIIYHQVQPGDTLWGIAQKYPGVSVDQLKKLNRITDAKGLKAGSKIKVSVDS